MKIAYKKEYLNVNLIFGIVWLVWFFVGYLSEEAPGWLHYGWLIISIFYFGIYYYQRNYQYLKIENGFIKVNGVWGKKIRLNEIRRIKKFAGDYTLITKNKSLTIYTQLITDNDLALLNKEFDKLALAIK